MRAMTTTERAASRRGAPLCAKGAPLGRAPLEAQRAPILRGRRVFAPCVASALLLLSVAQPSEAEAQAEAATAVVLFSSPAVGVLGTVFLVADVVYAVERGPLPFEWAVAQIVAGVIELAFGVTALIGIADNSPATGALAGFAGVGLVVGSWHIGHGVWSLLAPVEPSHEVALFASPLEGGALVGASGAF